jgi:hypothetical protein
MSPVPVAREGVRVLHGDGPDHRQEEEKMMMMMIPTHVKVLVFKA